MSSRSLSQMINEIVCDNILRKFEGNKTISRDKLREKGFYENIDPDFQIVEDHINYLIRDRTLKENESLISLTTKGWFILTNAEKVGYVARRIENVQWDKSERDAKVLFRWASALTALAIMAWFVYKFLIPQ